MKTKPTVRLIYATSLDNIIGDGKQLLWHIPEDLKYFKEKTKDSVIVMGGNTWLSIPQHLRPLDNRVNVVLTNQLSVITDVLNHCAFVANSLKDSLVYAKRAAGTIGSLYEVSADYADKDVWLIGGSQVLEEGLQYASEIYLTEVSRNYHEGVKAPYLDPKVWKTSKVGLWQRNYDGLLYRYVIKHKE